jgi:glycosyltransferase involved in cell wall biosynthesis
VADDELLRPDGRPVRVLHLITRVSRGGSEQRLRDVLASVPADHHVMVGRDSDPAQVDTLRKHATVSWNDDLVRDVRPSDLRAGTQLVAALRRERPDVMHTHQAKGGLLGRVSARAARVPIVYHSASMASFGPGYGRWESRAFALAERATAPLVRRYFVVGTDLADRMAANGVARHRLTVVRSSLDLSPFTPPSPAEQAAARERLGLDRDRRWLCYVGSLEPRKGVLGLAELREEVARASGREIGLVIAGDGPLRQELARQADGPVGAGPFRLLGHVPYVADVMRATDALVLPSSAEGVPQVVVQAAACGLPFAAYRVDGVGELLDLGADGIAVELGDRRGLAQAVVGLLARVGGPRRSGLTADAQAQWSADEVAAQYRRAYERDLSARRER